MPELTLEACPLFRMGNGKEGPRSGRVHNARVGEGSDASVMTASAVAVFARLSSGGKQTFTHLLVYLATHQLWCMTRCKLT